MEITGLCPGKPSLKGWLKPSQPYKTTLKNYHLCKLHSCNQMANIVYLIIKPLKVRVNNLLFA